VLELVIFLLPHAKEMGMGTRPSHYSPTQSPSPADFVYGASGAEAKIQAICSFNQAAVLIVLIHLAVMKAAPPP
jgi:hypothetical protein